jgi:SAM-dependent methyltransferase
MHKNSLDIMQKFLAPIPDEPFDILDLGSRVVEGQEELGSYKQFCKLNWTYTGADTEEGTNVDIVMENGYNFPFDDEKYGIIISGQTIEHVEYPWVWFLEMTRVLKKGGVCCIIAPAKIHEHRYPIDTYRYYPDGMRALAKWSGLTVLEVGRSVARKGMEDTYLLARK